MTTSVRAAGPALLQAEISSATPSVRSNAPIAVVWKIKSTSQGLLEGRLVVTATEGQETLARVAVDGVVLSPGEQFVRTVLPPIDFEAPVEALELSLTFIGRRQTVEIPGVTLRAPRRWQRSFVIAYSDPFRSTPGDEAKKLLESLRFESYNPGKDDRTINTYQSLIRPDAFPTDPLLYFGFDVVLLADDGFSELKQPQLEALEAWVDAGGSVCVAPGEAALLPAHLRFLNALIPGGAATPAYSVDRSGQLEAPASDVERVRFIRRGLGRAVVIAGRLAEAFPEEEPARRKVPAFLWKLRQDRLASFIDTGKWDVRRSLATETELSANSGPALSPVIVNPSADEPLRLLPQPIRTGDQLMARLMPSELRVVPLTLVGLLLMLYVLAVGPGDWFLLGALRRRKWTWWLFPIVTVAFAAFTIWLSHWYMRTDETRASVTILDVGDDNRIVRRNRLEILFSGTGREFATTISHGLLTAMNHQKFGSSTWYAYQQASFRGGADRFELADLPQYAGRFPAQYSVTQFVPQWTPQLNRLLELGDGDTPSGFDWNAYADPEQFGPWRFADSAFREELRKRVQSAFGPRATIYVMTGSNLEDLGSYGALFDQARTPGPYSPTYQPVRAYYNNDEGRARLQNGFLADLCAPSTGGLFALVSQSSPSGGKDFEDLAILDPSDSRQWVLIVAVERGAELLLFRKLYPGGK